MHKNVYSALRLKNSEEGFALIAAIMACMILLALGLLVISLSTQDIKVSVKIVGDKRSLAAAEEGIHAITKNFTGATALTQAQVNVTRADGVSSYSIMYPAKLPTSGTGCWPTINGSRNRGALKWKEYDLDVVGQNTSYNTQVRIKVGIGWPAVCD